MIMKIKKLFSIIIVLVFLIHSLIPVYATDLTLERKQSIIEYLESFKADPKEPNLTYIAKEIFGDGTTTIDGIIIEIGTKNIGIKELHALEKALEHSNLGLKLINNGNSIRAVNNQLTKSAEQLAKSNYLSKAGKALGAVGTVLGVISIGKDIYTYNDVQHKHASIDFIERTLKGASIISSTLEMVPVVGHVAKIPSKIFGLAKDAVGSQTFVNYMNKTGGRVLEVADGTMELFNAMAIHLFGGDAKEYLEEVRLKKRRLNQINNAIKTPNDVSCYKPNIYIYPESELDVKLTFDYPELLTKVIPNYKNEWKVKAYPNGNLIDESNKKHDYLFYESLTNKSFFETNEGFFIDKDARKENFESILSTYGLNEKEIADFNEFWCNKLDKHKNYIMYPQLTERVDYAMPIKIEPKPSTVYRIWFVFEEYREQDIITPNINPIERKGFTVIEWGGIIY